MRAQTTWELSRDARRSKGEAALALIKKADTEVNIFDVLQEFFNVNHPREGRSYKGYCPFAFEHPDPTDKGWRTYPASNRSFCFVMHGSMGPVRLIQNLKGMKATQAARFLLDHYGLGKPKHWRERFEEVRALRAKEQVDVGQTSYLVEALHMALESISGYEDVRFSEVFNTALETRLEVLDTLLLAGASEQEVSDWYENTKNDLIRLVGGQGG